MAKFGKTEQAIIGEILNRYQDAYNAAPFWAVTQIEHLHDQLCRNYLPNQLQDDALRSLEMKLQSHNGQGYTISRYRHARHTIDASLKYHEANAAKTTALPLLKRILQRAKGPERTPNSWSPTAHLKM